MRYHVEKMMEGVHIMWNISIYTQYYDIDITPIFMDKTTYFHWLPKDLINIIKSYDLYDIQEGDIIYHKSHSYYSKVVEILTTKSRYDAQHEYMRREGKYKCDSNINIKNMFINHNINIYRKRLQPSYCNIV